MKLAFSTLACPNWSWQDIISAAKDFGFDGIEVRGLGEEVFAVRAQPFAAEELPGTIKRLDTLRLSIPCFSSDCCLKYKERKAENLAEISEYIKLAGKLRTPYVRILADSAPAPAGDEIDDLSIAEQLKTLAQVAEQHNVTLLVETNGVYCDTSRLYRLLEQVASDAVGALWDVHHPYRFAAETAEKTIQNLGTYIKYVHVKDSVVDSGGNVQYRMMGEGDLPIAEMMLAL
ncbi:MAG: sugar phosphate isomerase/epimerase, partial [Dehalococcoidia bacterium]|nr:sugar phosphate isomerase/epimerase [Dehalococcoidia bacterium]